MITLSVSIIRLLFCGWKWFIYLWSFKLLVHCFNELILFQWEELLSNPFFQLKFFVKDRKGYCCRSRWKTIDLSLFLSLWNTHKHTHTLTNSQTHTHAYKESSEKKRIGLFSVDKIFFNLGLFDHEKILLKVVRLKYYWSCWTRKPRSFLKWPSLKFKKYTAI